MSINTVKGFSRSGAFEDIMYAANQSTEDCRKLALQDSKYVAWGHRNANHRSRKNTCFLYTSLPPFEGDWGDNTHTTGCLEPGQQVAMGCRKVSTGQENPGQENPGQEYPAIVYRDCGYGGQSTVLPNEGSYTLGNLQSLGIRNDDISAIRVSKGYNVTLHEHDYFSGRAIPINGANNVSCLRDSPYDFNDKVSSIKITKAVQPVTLFENCDYNGYTNKMVAGSYKSDDVRLYMNNKPIQSLTVLADYDVTIYDSTTINSGKSLTFNGPVNIPCLKWIGFRNVIPSMVIKQRSGSVTSASLLDKIDYVKGWSGNHENPYIPNQTQEGCRQLALLNSSKYVAWGHRNNSHPDAHLRNTCFLYTSPFDPYSGNSKDNIHTTGCLNLGDKLEWGCRNKPVAIYSGINYDGDVLLLDVGDYTYSTLNKINPYFNKDKKSLFVAAGYTVTIYEKDNFQGNATMHGSSAPIKIQNVTSFDNKKSSISVSKNQPAALLTKLSAFNKPITVSQVGVTHPNSKECSVYFVKNTEVCDKGDFNLSESEIRKKYDNNYRDIINEKKNLNNTMCKVTYDNWYRTVNSPLINNEAYGLENRGDPSTWAYCYKPLTLEPLQNVIDSMRDSKSVYISNERFPNVLEEGTNYARMNFNKLDYDYIVNDACSVNKRSSVKIPNDNYLVLTIDKKTRNIKNMQVEKSEENILISTTANEQISVLKKLYEDVIQPVDPVTDTYKLIYRPRTVSATIYMLALNSCDNIVNTGSSTGLFTLQDFGATSKILYLYNKSDIARYNNKKLLNELEKEVGMISDAALKSEIQNVISTLNTNITNIINEQIKNIIGKTLHAGIPNELLSDLQDNSAGLMKLIMKIH